MCTCSHEGTGAPNDQNLQILAHMGKLVLMNSAFILRGVAFLRKIDHILYCMKDQFLTEEADSSGKSLKISFPALNSK